ncbi:VOC family protein [Dyella japonica]|uniref:Glyoxalase n=1 Tax=Dyella japonica DSM 16301 TaxID=1440762 RepID=A0A0G9H1Q2_9GAMM|nr:VOC family protein [Dyella japonica]KLD63755.1 glyoxalase [Dyella japonica DSM 16301]
MNDSNALTAGIDHVGLTVSDIELSRAFFVQCLGWRVVGGNPGYPAVFVSDGTSVLTLWQVDGADGHQSFDRRKNIGLHHVALKVASEEALHALFARVAGWPGVEVEFPPEAVGNLGNMHGFVREPGGTRVEFRYSVPA